MTDRLVQTLDSSGCGTRGTVRVGCKGARLLQSVPDKSRFVLPVVYWVCKNLFKNIIFCQSSHAQLT